MLILFDEILFLYKKKYLDMEYIIFYFFLKNKIIYKKNKNI